jgi:hypothetical protein
MDLLLNDLSPVFQEGYNMADAAIENMDQV